jgi:hypothetical protein
VTENSAGFVVQPGSSLAQFLVDKFCPFEKPQVPRRNIKAVMPFMIIVDLSAKVKRPKGCRCKGKKWIVPMEAAAGIRAAVGFKSTDGDRTVCEHMGHLIE